MIGGRSIVPWRLGAVHKGEAMLKCAACKKVVGKLGDMHECTDGELKFCLAAGPVAPDAAAAPSGSVAVHVPAQYQSAFAPAQNITIRPPAKERGGSFTVNGWIALALVALAAGQTSYIVHLLHQQPTVIVMPIVSGDAQPEPTSYKEPLFNYSLTGGFPPCGQLGNICWINI